MTMNKDIYPILKSYGPLITYISYIDQYNDDRDFEQVKDDIYELLNVCEKKLTKIDENNLNNFLLPLLVFIDEKILLSTWEFKNRWMSSVLQQKYFNTLDGGKLFFDNFESFNNVSDEKLKLIYGYFIHLGFQGKYYNNDKYEIEALHDENKKYLANHLDYGISDFFRLNYGIKQQHRQKNNFAFKRNILLVLIGFIFMAFVFVLSTRLESRLEKFNGHTDNKHQDISKQDINET